MMAASRTSRTADILADGDEIARTAGIKGALLGYLPKRWPKWFDPKPLAWQPAPYGPFSPQRAPDRSGRRDRRPDAGHTPGHLSVIVRDGDEQIMLAGDTSYLESTMLGGTIDGVSPDETARRDSVAQHWGISAPCAQQSRPSICRATIRSLPTAWRQRSAVGMQRQMRKATTWPPSATIVAPVM